MYELGLGNQSGNIEEEFEKWCRGAMGAIYGKEGAEEERKETLIEDREILVYWGSQTGTARGFAEQLAVSTNRKNIQFTVKDLNDFDEVQFKKSRYVVFIVATFGSGGPTKNAQKFYDWMKNQPTSKILSNLKFTVFGCGNANFQATYNKMAKFTYETMQNLGANMYIYIYIYVVCMN